MDLLQLKYFEMVAEMGNVTRAAESLHIAQPSLSNTIARLEEDLGVQLFDRRGRRIVLNQFGEAFLERVKRIFHELDQGKRELMDMTGLTFGKVTIATTTSQIIPDIFSDFLATYPDVRFKLFQVTGRLEIPNQLGAGAFDFCISSLPIMQIPGMEKVVEEYLTTEEIFVAVPPGHALAEENRRSAVRTHGREDHRLYAGGGRADHHQRGLPQGRFRAQYRVRERRHGHHLPPCPVRSGHRVFAGILVEVRPDRGPG